MEPPRKKQKSAATHPSLDVHTLQQVLWEVRSNKDQTIAHLKALLLEATLERERLELLLQERADQDATVEAEAAAQLLELWPRKPVAQCRVWNRAVASIDRWISAQRGPVPWAPLRKLQLLCVDNIDRKNLCAICLRVGREAMRRGVLHSPIK